MDKLFALGEQKENWNEGVQVKGTKHDIRLDGRQRIEATDAAIAKADEEREARNAKATYGDVAKAAWGQSVTNLAVEWAQSQSQWKPDPNFKLTPEKVNQAMQGMPEDYLDYVLEAQSDSHMEAIVQNLKTQQERNQTIASKGVLPAVTAMVGMAVADPVSVVGSVATGGLLAPLVTAGRVTRIANMARAGMLGAATSVPAEVLQAQLDVDYGVSDALIGVAAGGLLGSAFGAATKVDRGVVNSLQRAGELEDIKAAEKAGLVPSEDVLKRFPELTDGTGKYVPPAERNKGDTSGKADDFTSMSAFRFDRASFNLSSENLEMREFASKFLHDPNPAKGKVVKEAAVEVAQQTYDQWMSKFVMNHTFFYEDFRKQAGMAGKKMSHADFNDEVYKAYRGVKSEYQAANTMAERIKKQYDEVLKELQGVNRSGVPVKGAGFEADPNYMTRFWSTPKIAAMVQRLGGVEQAAAHLSKFIKGYDGDKALKVARHIIDLSQRSKSGSVNLSGLNGNAETVTTFLHRELGLDFQEAKALADRMTNDLGGPDAGNAGHLKFRIDLDELGAMDYLETDITTIFNRYSKSMSGHLALARQGFASEMDFWTALDGIKAKYAGTKASQSRINREIKNMEDALAHMLGRSLDPDANTTWARGSRIIRKWNFTRLMNMMGVSALVDTFNILGQTGVAATLRHIPQLRVIGRGLKDGKLLDELANDIALGTGWGKKHLVSRATQRAEEIAVDGKVVKSGYGKVDSALDTAGHFTSTISGMNIVQEATHILAGAGMLQSYLDAFRKGKPHTLSQARLNELNMSPELYSRVRDEFMKKGGVSYDPKSGKLLRVHWDKWDAETARQFQYSLRRWGSFLSQEQGFGSLPTMADRWWGQLLLQFRTFVMGAWTKQTLNNLKHRDATAVKTAAATFAGGVISYHLYAAIRLAGLPPEKRDKEWNRLFDPEGTGDIDASHVGMQALLRTGFMSLIPSMTDSVLPPLGFDPLFGERNSGLDSGVMGLPFLDLASKSVKAATELSAAVRQGEVTSDAVKAFTAITAGSNAAVVSSYFKSLMEDALPENESK